MARRLEFQALLETLLGTRNVYFQPPEGFQMRYPCIVYSRDQMDEKFADDLLYSKTVCYRVMILDRDPDSAVPDKVAELRFSSFVTHYKVDQVNHDIYNVYF